MGTWLTSTRNGLDICVGRRLRTAVPPRLARRLNLIVAAVACAVLVAPSISTASHGGLNPRIQIASWVIWYDDLTPGGINGMNNARSTDVDPTDINTSTTNSHGTGLGRLHAREGRRRVSRPEGDRLMPDFLIGAHAEIGGFRLLTRDPRVYRRWFPAVPLIAPDV